MADQKISQLPAAGAITGVELVPVVQSSQTVQTTVNAILSVLSAVYQPLDSDLSAIAALSTTPYGRALLTLANDTALRAAAGLVLGTDIYSKAAVDAGFQPLDSDLSAIAGLTPTNDDIIQRKAGAWTNRTMAQLIADLAALGTTFQPLDSDLTAIAALTTTSFGRSLLTQATDREAAGTLMVPYMLAGSGVAVSHTGDTSEFAFATVSIPAAAMGANGALDGEAIWSVTNNGNTKTTRVRLGGVSGTVMDTSTPVSVAAQRRLFRIRNRNSASSQVSGSSGSVSGTGTINNPTTGAQNTGNALDLVISGQLANSGDTMTLEEYRLYLLRRA